VPSAAESSRLLQANNIKIDVVAGTSIGGINAAIIAGGKQEGHPEKVLEQYWLELADGSTHIRSSRHSFEKEIRKKIYTVI
jgi:NTE family protein